MNEINTTELIARLILSTKRKKRYCSIIEIATDIATLKNKLGGLNEVSKVVGITPGMLNKFLSVFQLPNFIRKLIQERKIDSVAIVHLLSKLTNDDIKLLAPKIMAGEVNSEILKMLVPYKNQHRNENVLELLSRLEASRNIQVSIIRFPKNMIKKSIGNISEIVEAIVGQENFLSVTEEGVHIDIKVKKPGEKILRLKAKEKKMTLTGLIATLIK